MSMVDIKWNGEEFFRQYKREMAKKLTECVARMQAWAVDHMNRQGSKFDHSAPGEYPKRQSGHLIKNVPYEVDGEELMARFGTNVKYGRYLEEGTKRMAKRPWLTRVIKETKNEVNRILRKPILTRSK